MTNNQREAYEALINEIGLLFFDAMNVPCVPGDYAKAVLSLIAKRLSGVTEEMVNVGCEEINQHPENVFRAMLRASLLFPGDPE